MKYDEQDRQGSSEYTYSASDKRETRAPLKFNQYHKINQKTRARPLDVSHSQVGNQILAVC